MQTGIARVEANGERRPLANSTNLQNRNRGLGILEIHIAILFEAFFCLKTQNRSAYRVLPSLLESWRCSYMQHFSSQYCSYCHEKDGSMAMFICLLWSLPDDQKIHPSMVDTVCYSIATQHYGTASSTPGNSPAITAQKGEKGTGRQRRAAGCKYFFILNKIYCKSQITTIPLI